jgi:hypothetical protein
MKMDKPSSFEKACAKHVWQGVMEICSKFIVESMIDSKLIVDGSIGDY